MATAAAHAAAERSFHWQVQLSTRDGYRDTLAALYGFHAAWEPRIAGLLCDPAFFDDRRRTHLLADDLRQLGFPVDSLARVPGAVLPLLPGRAAAFGSLYVVEGSRLGGRLIARHVERVLSLRPDAGLSYYGAPPAASWRGFCDRLEAELGTDAAVEAAVAAALATFDCLGRVLAGTAAPEAVG